MDTLTLTLTEEQSVLVQELLEKVLHEQEIFISNSNNTEYTIKKAQFNSECVRLLLQALQQGYRAVNMPGNLMKPVLGLLKFELESQMAIMLDLMQDESLVQDNQIQVIKRGIKLLSVMRCMTYEALQTEKEAA